MEKIVAYLDFHGCLLRVARPNRILNRHDQKRERDRGQSAFCVPINHFSPPPYPMSRSPSCWTKPFPDPRSLHHMGQRPEFLRQGIPEQPTPDRCLEAHYPQQTRFESIVERKLRCRQPMMPNRSSETAGASSARPSSTQTHLTASKSRSQTNPRDPKSSTRKGQWNGKSSRRNRD